MEPFLQLIACDQVRARRFGQRGAVMFKCPAQLSRRSLSGDDDEGELRIGACTWHPQDRDEAAERVQIGDATEPRPAGRDHRPN